MTNTSQSQPMTCTPFIPVLKTDAAEILRVQLLDQTLALRIKAFEEFEQTCKATGLMAGRKASPTKRKVTKPR